MIDSKRKQAECSTCIGLVTVAAFPLAAVGSSRWVERRWQGTVQGCCHQHALQWRAVRRKPAHKGKSAACLQHAHLESMLAQCLGRSDIACASLLEWVAWTSALNYTSFKALAGTRTPDPNHKQSGIASAAHRKLMCCTSGLSKPAFGILLALQRSSALHTSQRGADRKTHFCCWPSTQQMSSAALLCKHHLICRACTAYQVILHAEC